MAEFLVYPRTTLSSFSLLTGSIPGHSVLFCPWKRSRGRGCESPAASRRLMNLHMQRPLGQTRVRWNTPPSGASPPEHLTHLRLHREMTNSVGKNGPVASYRTQPSRYVPQLKLLPSPTFISHVGLSPPATVGECGGPVCRATGICGRGPFKPALRLSSIPRSENTHNRSLIFSPGPACPETAVTRLAGPRL